MSEREKLKKLAEAAKRTLRQDGRLPEWRELVEIANPSTILALLSELEAAEKFKKYVHDRLDAAGIDKHEEQNALNGCRIGSRLDDVLALRTDHHAADRGRQARTPEESVRFINSDHPCCLPIGDVCQITAALRTLREASQREVDMQQMSPAKYAEKYGLTLSLGVYVAEEKRVIAALAAALAAEGGK
jgi:hypothetical protein